MKVKVKVKVKVFLYLANNIKQAIAEELLLKYIPVCQLTQVHAQNESKKNCFKTTTKAGYCLLKSDKDFTIILYSSFTFNCAFIKYKVTSLEIQIKFQFFKAR